MDIANIYIALYLYYPHLYHHVSLLTETSSPIKTPIYSSIYGRRVTHFVITPTFLPIASTPAVAAATTTTSASI